MVIAESSFFDHSTQKVIISLKISLLTIDSEFYPSGLFKNAAGCKNECDKDSQIQSSIQYTCTTTKCIDNVLRVEVFVLNNFGMVINTIEARLFRVGFENVMRWAGMQIKAGSTVL